MQSPVTVGVPNSHRTCADGLIIGTPSGYRLALEGRNE